ncbi:MFS transporter [Sandaracinobacteroides saxicola]|uniref:MFS transporter n=1 Tax=Sandaracinobacteroides saxicola TaxID=2759707 RepID=UPI001FB19585|nr:MFS transporter [Sandaracinobacteroides saxicola]
MTQRTGSRLPGSAIAWASFEGLRNPLIILCTIYVFAPYYVGTVAASPVAGQALIAQANQYAGWMVALTAPLMGVVVDRMGPRKPGLAIIVALLLPILWTLWFVVPGGPIGAGAVLMLFTAYTALFAWTEVFHNALLVPAAKGEVAHTSGLGLALGNLFSVAALVAVLWMFALPGSVDWPGVPDAPLFGVDAAAHEPARLVGPLSAVLVALGLLVIVLGVPDAPRTGVRLGAALRAGLADLRAMLGELKRNREAAKFLLARMLYADGKTVIIAMGGVLASGVMGWGTLDMLAYGIILSVFAVLGGFLAGPLDNAIGPKRAILIEIGVTSAVLVALLLSDQGRIAGFAVPAAPLWGGPVFQTLPELGYLALACISAVSITAAYASSRTMLAVLVPVEKSASFFGLYVLSGTATMWLGPTLLAIATSYFQSQQAGFATVHLLLGAGFAVLLTVRAPGGRVVAV